MKLITFQSQEALDILLTTGTLICDEEKINKEKYGYAYDYIVEEMNKKIDNKSKIKYPIWCWVKCFNSICPAKRKGKKVPNYDVKITFHKEEKDVFITDFALYSFLLNNVYIPSSKEDKELFDKELKKYNITEEELKAYVRKDKYKSHRMDKDYLTIVSKIRKSFSKFISKNAKILQGCIWQINIDEVEKIEILKDDGYTYGTLNYIRKNGQSKNWIKDYYKELK